MENQSNFKSTGIICKIFNNHWDEFYSYCKNTLSIERSNSNKEVHKMITFLFSKNVILRKLFLERLCEI